VDRAGVNVALANSAAWNACSVDARKRGRIWMLDQRSARLTTSISSAIFLRCSQNLAFAFIYNAAGVPIAAGVRYPVLGILLSPMIGAAAVALSSVSVIANALRLARVRI
jgi:cation transport ATPase